MFSNVRLSNIRLSNVHFLYPIFILLSIYAIFLKEHKEKEKNRVAERKQDLALV